MIRTEHDGNLTAITLDRPERRNALTWEALDDLESAVRAAETPVLYLAGSGKAFCAGADLNVVSQLSRADAVAFARRGQQVANALEAYDGAVVAGIDGPARGGGVELALACDIRLATGDATFAETGVSLGLFGAWGGTRRLPRIVGEGEALDIGLSGRELDATEARRMGLVSRIVASPRAVAARIAENDADALRVIKKRLRDNAGQAAQERRETAAFGALIEAFESEGQ
ncbi:MAG: enoyl-CoA hydratase/isomerase family protein [Halolamina sp.]